MTTEQASSKGYFGYGKDEDWIAYLIVAVALLFVLIAFALTRTTKVQVKESRILRHLKDHVVLYSTLSAIILAIIVYLTLAALQIIPPGKWNIFHSHAGTLAKAANEGHDKKPPSTDHGDRDKQPDKDKNKNFLWEAFKSYWKHH